MGKMSAIQIIPIPLIFIIGLSSCGSDFIANISPRRSDPQEEHQHRLRSPIAMRLADPTCQAQSRLMSLGNRNVLRFDGVRLASKAIQFNANSGPFGLTAAGLASTSYGDDRQAIRRWLQNGNSYHYTEVNSINSAGTYLKLCDGFEDHDPNTIENAGLSVVSLVEAGFRHPVFRDFAVNSGKQLQLSLLPMYETIEIQESSVQGRVNFAYHATDNASWSLGSVNGQDQTKLTFYPQSKELQESGVFGGVSLYYVPFVIAHELGHEFFYRLMPAYFANISEAESQALWHENSSYRSRWSVDPRIEAHQSLQSSSLSQSAVTNAELITSVSEAFADMLGYYTIEAQERNLSALPCLSHRDPRKKSFSKDVDKSLTADFINAYMRKQTPLEFKNRHLENDSRCPLIFVSDPHILGTIIAHHFVTLLDMRSPSGSHAVGFLRTWLERLNQSIERHYFDVGPKQLLSTVVFDFLETLRVVGPFNEKECQKIGHSFKDLNQGWDLGC